MCPRGLHLCTLVCVFTVQVPVQIFLVLLQTVTGLAVLYLPAAGTNTKLTLIIK